MVLKKVSIIQVYLLRRCRQYNRGHISVVNMRGYDLSNL
jgi:hypothetical protein